MGNNALPLMKIALWRGGGVAIYKEHNKVENCKKTNDDVNIGIDSYVFNHKTLK
jgi:hypothetical protein